MPQTVNIPERLPISIDPDRLTALCHHYGIRELALFGSVLRDDFTLQSDVDVLYDMGPTSPIRSLFDLGRLVGDLEGLLGRRVGLCQMRMTNLALKRQGYGRFSRPTMLYLPIAPTTLPR